MRPQNYISSEDDHAAKPYITENRNQNIIYNESNPHLYYQSILANPQVQYKNVNPRNGDKDNINPPEYQNNSPKIPLNLHSERHHDTPRQPVLETDRNDVHYITEERHYGLSEEESPKIPINLNTNRMATPDYTYFQSNNDNPWSSNIDQNNELQVNKYYQFNPPTSGKRVKFPEHLNYENDNFNYEETNYSVNDIINSDFKSLYECRGREINDLHTELNDLKSSTDLKIGNLKTEIEKLQVNKQENEYKIMQLDVILKDKELKCHDLTKENKNFETTLKSLQEDNKKLKLKVQSYESEVYSLQMQVSELQTSDCMAKARKSHEDFVEKLNRNYKEDKELLQTKLESKVKEFENKQSEIDTLNHLLEETQKRHEKLLLSKDKQIKELTVDLQTKEDQCKSLFQNQQLSFELEQKLQEYEKKLNFADKKIKKLQCEVEQANESLENYKTAFKISAIDIKNDSDFSVDALGLCKNLSYSESVNNSTKTDSDEKQNQTNEINKNVSKKGLLSILNVYYTQIYTIL